MVDNIDNKRFNNLAFDYDDNFAKVAKSDLQTLIANNLNNDFKVLTYTNKSCSMVNLWVKKSILRNGTDLTINDLVLINNNVDATLLENTLIPTKRLFNGDFAWIEDIGEAHSYLIEIKNKEPITLFFKNLTLKLCDSGEIVETCYLENYLAEDLSEDGKLALKILINQKLNLLLKSFPFEGSQTEKKVIASDEYQDQLRVINGLEAQLKNGDKVVTKLKQVEATLKRIVKKARRYHKRDSMHLVRGDITSDYFMLSNSLNLRYGWCITVNKAMSYRWDSILLDANAGNRGAMKDSYYRWLYSAITRANHKVSIINLKIISPFNKIVIEDKHVARSTPPAYLVLDSAIEKELPRQHGFEQSEFLSILVQIYDHVNNMIEASGIRIKSIRHNNYKEVYELTDGTNISAVNFSYKKNGQIRLQKPSGSNEGLNTKLASLLANPKGLDDFSFLEPDWKIGCYECIGEALTAKGYSIQWISQVDWKDFIKIANRDSYLLADFNYKSTGVFTKVVMTEYSDDAIKTAFVGALESLMPKRSTDNG